MWGLSRTKTVRLLEEQRDELTASYAASSNKKRAELAALLSKQSVAEVQRGAADKRAEKANERAGEAEQRLRELKRAMPKRHRVGWVDIEPTKLTAMLRGIADQGLRVEVDNQRLWVYSTRGLSEAEFNAVQAKLPFTLDRT